MDRPMTFPTFLLALGLATLLVAMLRAGIR